MKILNRRQFILGLGMLPIASYTKAGRASETLKKPIEKLTANFQDLTKVSVQKCTTYETKFLRKYIQQMFDDIGGLGDIIKPGYSVGIKINLTGGIQAAGKLQKQTHQPAKETFWSHPEVTRVVSELIKDAGAGKLYFMDASYDGIKSFALDGFDLVARAVGAEIINLNKPEPYKEFQITKVEPHYIWPEFTMNRLLNELDVYVSINKMKQHGAAGVTLSLKNQVGIVPLSVDAYTKGAGSRAGFHAPGENFLVKTTVDLNVARPIDLAFIDGITTIEGGEGPWIRNLNPVKPGLLVAGKNPVAVDAVCTSLMGFDPEAKDKDQPFRNCHNYLRLADLDRHMGNHRLKNIEVIGTPIQTARFDFAPMASKATMKRLYGIDSSLPYGGWLG